MKPLVKIVCCGALLAWVHSAIAAGANTQPPSQPSDTGVKVYPVKKMDRARVEKRLEDKSAQTRARSLQAKKSAQGQQAAPNVNPK